MKKLGITILLLLSVVATGCACDKKKDDKPMDENKQKEELHLNTSADLIKEQTIKEVKFSNISLLIDAGTSKFNCTVTNTTADAKVVGTVNFAFKDKDGKVLYHQDYQMNVLAKEEVTTISFTSDMNLSDATSLEIIIK